MDKPVKLEAEPDEDEAAGTTKKPDCHSSEEKMVGGRNLKTLDALAHVIPMLVLMR